MAKPFSQRYGYVKVEDIIQVESLNGAARTAIWNVLYKILEIGSSSPPNDTYTFLRAIWTDYLNNSADGIPHLWEGAGYSITMERILRNAIYKDDWYAVFDMIEFLIENVSIMRKQSLTEAFNNYLLTKINQ